MYVFIFLLFACCCRAKFHEHWFRYVTTGVVGVFGSLLARSRLNTSG